MKLLSDNIQLELTDDQDDRTDAIFEDADDLFNMSETRLYPKNLPLEMSFLIKKSDELVGQIKLNRIRWYNRKAEVSLAIAKKYQKKGLGSEALDKLLNYAFNKMNLHRIEAEVIEYNEASIKLVNKFKFTEDGRLREAKYSNGKYWDIIRYGLLKKEYNSR